MLAGGKQGLQAGQPAQAQPGSAAGAGSLVLDRSREAVEELGLGLQQLVAQVVHVDDGHMGKGGQVGGPDDLCGSGGRLSVVGPPFTDNAEAVLPQLWQSGEGGWAGIVRDQGEPGSPHHLSRKLLSLPFAPFLAYRFGSLVSS